MGFFSWTCAKCEKSILADVAVAGYRKFAEARAIFKNGDRISGTYDGYGQIDGYEVDPDDGNCKLVHKHCHEPTDTFESLGENGYCGKQGYFFSPKDLEETFGPPNFDELDETNFACLGCLNTWRSKWTASCPHCDAEESPISYYETATIIEHSLCGKRSVSSDYDEPSRCNDVMCCFGKKDAPENYRHKGTFTTLELNCQD